MPSLQIKFYEHNARLLYDYQLIQVNVSDDGPIGEQNHQLNTPLVRLYAFKLKSKHYYEIDQTGELRY